MAHSMQEKPIHDEVHQNQILRELILKELRAQKLHTEYHVNPLRKVHTVTRKPMSWHDNLEEPADVAFPSASSRGWFLCSVQSPPSLISCMTLVRFLNLIHHAAQGPRKKYPETQTENQEIGWNSEPLKSPAQILPGLADKALLQILHASPAS
ncbi:protein FAM183A isoform X2 [Nannospalax galili]|uniref:protein FAM183A isoform X2 n=1 Tax=Nannospalax galili TaxID=1026970 RepID=UPI00111C343A|nr:protein FAM183A isoform X2 [Nannospalax galili]